MRLVALLLLGWLYALEAGADPQVRQHLHELRTRSALLCASALLHFNPQQQAQDARALASSYDSLNLLATRVVQLGQPEPLAAQLSDMQRLFKVLERLPRADAGQYPALLTQLLQRQQAMAYWAGERLAHEAAAARPATELLQQQSLAMARLLLDYQARGYPFASPYQGLTASEREALDLDLDSGFRELGEAGLTETLDSVRKGYRFIRSQLLASRPRPSSGGVEFYLARGVIDMDELAAAAPEPAVP